MCGLRVDRGFCEETQKWCRVLCSRLFKFFENGDGVTKRQIRSYFLIFDFLSVARVQQERVVGCSCKKVYCFWVVKAEIISLSLYFRKIPLILLLAHKTRRETSNRFFPDSSDFVTRCSRKRGEEKKNLLVHGISNF